MSKMDYNTFDSVCKYLTIITNKSKIKKISPSEVLEEWFYKVPQREVLYPIIKFLLPKYDGRIYKIKELTLAKFISQTLGLNKSDTCILVNYNKPNMYQISNNFGMLAYNICKNKGLVSMEKNDITIQQMDMWLTLLTEDPNFIKTILPQLNGIQLLWFCNILLKQVKVGQVTVLKAYHPDAPAYWNIDRNLEKLCTKLLSLKTRFDVNKIEWGNNFNPMLCEGVTYDKFDIQGAVYVETKWDGERLMLHYRKKGEYNDELGDIICYTRNGKNYTNFYKNMMLHFKDALTPFDDCIVDGEIVLTDKNTGEIVPKANIYNGADRENYNMRYIIFDIVYVNGESIAMLTLTKRMNYLAKIIQNPFVKLTDFKLCSSRQDVLTLFTRSIETHQEGIVIKNEESTYTVGCRKKMFWAKMKPDYEDAIADDLDLVILGGYYAEGTSTTKSITSFLVGFLSKQNGQFKSVTSVGNGFTQDMYNTILKKLEPFSYNPTLPKMLNIVLGEHQPDVLYNPMKSIILQIRAASVIESKSTGSKMNLRFPRCVAIRHDKKCTETTIPCISNLKEKRVENLKITEKDDNLPIWEKCEKLWYYTPLVDKNNVIQLDTLFQNMKFTISTVKSECKQEFEQIIIEHGGIVYQTPDNNTIMVAEKMTPSLQIYTKKDRIEKISNKKIQVTEHNIVKLEWIKECITYGEIRAMNDENSWHTREDLFLQGSTYYFEPDIQYNHIDKVKQHGANITNDISKADNIIVLNMTNSNKYQGICAKFHTVDWINQQLNEHRYETYEHPIIPVSKSKSKMIVYIDSDLDMKKWIPILEKKYENITIVTTFDSPITHVLISQKPTAISFGTENKLTIYNELRKRRPKFEYILTKSL